MAEGWTRTEARLMAGITADQWRMADGLGMPDMAAEAALEVARLRAWLGVRGARSALIPTTGWPT